MNLEKLKPWNWFKHEDNQFQKSENQIPVTKAEAQDIALFDRDPFMQLHNEIDQLFSKVIDRFGVAGINRWPSRNLTSSALTNLIRSDFRSNIDISGDNNIYEVAVDVPGFNSDDLKIEVDGNLLQISGKVEGEKDAKDKKYYRMERRYGMFQRTLTLPDDANADEINANLKNGVLKLVIPRRSLPQSEGRRIEILQS